MNQNLNLNSIYLDFFGEEKKQEVKENPTKTDNLESELDNLYIDEYSKELLKKVIIYMENYHKKEEKNNLPFYLSIEASKPNITKEIISIIEHANKKFQYTTNFEIFYLSFYEIEKKEALDEFFKSNKGILIIKDLEAFLMKEEETKRELIHELKEHLLDNKIAILLGTHDELKQFYEYDYDLKENYFLFALKTIKPQVNDIYEMVLKSIQLEEEKKIMLLDYITLTYEKSEADYLTYTQNLINYLSFYKDIPDLPKTKSTEEIFKDLNELVGLNKVKKTLMELVDLITLKKKSKDIEMDQVNLHMVFLGNPGTGKTTVARMICHILYDLDYIKQNKLIEVSSKDLIGEYVGQTAPKTMNVINRAINGVLFIDEAYALKDEKTTNTYNGEAIATLIKAMEDYRNELVVIFAGYTKEMQSFLNSNSGIVSRIGYTLEFDDYTNEELKEIFQKMMQKAGFKVEKEALEEFNKIVKENRETKNFGNARFVRNVYEKSILKHASNTKNFKNKQILKTITKKDISI